MDIIDILHEWFIENAQQSPNNDDPWDGFGGTSWVEGQNYKPLPAPFTIKDVEAILGFSETKEDEWDGTVDAVILLHNGLYAYCHYWWGPTFNGGETKLSDNLEDLLVYGMECGMRKELGL